MEGKKLERVLSILFFAAAGVLFFMFLGVALYIGLILCLALVAFVFVTAGAEKAQEWWAVHSPQVIAWYRRVWYRFRSWVKPQGFYEVHEVDADKVEILTPEEYRKEREQKKSER